MKKILSIMLLSALLLTSCTEPNVDTSSQDSSSETVSQESSEAPSNAETSSADVSSESEETPSYVYARRGEESLYVKNAQEIIDALKAKDGDFQANAKREDANFNPVSSNLIQVYEYTLKEYAETGKIEPRPTQRYYYRDSWFISEHEDMVSISNLGNRAYGLIPFKDKVYVLEELQINIKTMNVTLVEVVDLGLYYYVDDGQTQILIASKDVDGGYALDNSAMLLLYDTTDGKPYNCIFLNENIQLRAKGIIADEEEYSQIMYEKYGENNTTTGGKGWDDKSVLADYFGGDINPKYMQYLGQSNGWRIYHATYEGQACDTAIIEKDLGGYKFYSSGIYYPSEVSIYAIKRGEVLTLEQAYEKGEIDIKEVHEFTPDEYKR